MSESFQIYLNSTNADNINNNIYNFILPNLEIADGNYIYLSVQYASIPYSFYNINTTNNVLIYTLNLVNYTVTITPGNYNITQLLTFLKSNMPGFTISYNSITNKMTFSHSTYNFTFLSTSTCQGIFRFKTNTNYTSTTLSIISINCVSLIPIKCINQISNITIKLTDQNNNILNLIGLDFFLTIQLDIEKFN